MINVSANIKALFVAATAVMVVLLYFLSLGTASNTLNLVGFACLVGTSLFILKSKGGWIFFLYAFGLTFASASGVLDEFLEIYLFEIGEIASLSGAAARNAFLSSSFLVMAYGTYRFFLRFLPHRLPRIKTGETIAIKILLAIAFAAPIYIAVVLFIFGSPLFLGIDRFVYFTNIAPRGYVWLYGNIPLLGFVIAFCAYKGTIRHRTSTIWLIFTVTTYIFAGEKFSQLLLLGFFFFLPFFLISSPIIKVKHIIAGATALFCMGSLVVFNYIAVYGSSEIFVPRLALQGQMNYALDLITDSTQPVSNIIKCFAGIGAQDVEHGLVYLMYLVAPQSVVDLRIEYGATFTAPFPANISYFFGYYLSPLAIIALSIILGAISSILHISIVSLNIILSGLVLKTFLLTYVAIMMGNMSLLLGPKGAIHFGAIFFYLIIAYASSRQRT